MSFPRRIVTEPAVWKWAGVLLLLFAVLLLTAPAEEKVCKKCGAPLEPGAAFCTRCGAKLEAGEAPPDVKTRPAQRFRASVVQLVANHGREIISTYAAIEHGTTVKVESIVGSAFAIAPGEFVTDAGLVTGAKDVLLRTAAGKSVPATVKGIDPMIGVALLAADLRDVPPLPPGDGEPPGTGVSLEAVGFPSGGGAGTGVASSSGVVSGTGRIDLGMHSVEDYIQTDAPLPRGFAGGPIVDSEGRYAGMCTGWPFGRHMVMGPETGIGLSIPVKWIDRALAWIRADRPPRAWFGVLTEGADAETRKSHNLPPEVNRFVDYVFPGSPGEAAGLRRGDGILSIEGTTVTQLVHIQERLLTTSPGTAWTLEVLRQGKRTAVPVVLSARPERPRLRGVDALRLYGGIELQAEEADRIVVSRVLPDSEALSAGVQAGDVLTHLLSKKDLDRPDRDSARWRAVKDSADLERLLDLAYSDFDFYVGLRFKPPRGEKRHLYLLEFLLPSKAI